MNIPKISVWLGVTSPAPGNVVFSNVTIYFFFSWLYSPSRPRPPLWGSSTTLRHTTLDRTPLDISMQFWGRNYLRGTHDYNICSPDSRGKARWNFE